MAKDYARYASKPQKPVKKNRELDTFIILLIVLLIGGAGYWFYADKIRPNLSHDKSLGGLLSAVRLVFHHKTASSVLATKATTPPPGTSDEVHFDFYNQLPTMQVRVTTSQAIGATQPSQPGYVLQLALFNNLNEATQARISYLLAGTDANIVKVGTSYRVQQGPYASASVAKVIQKKLHKKGIETVLKKTIT